MEVEWSSLTSDGEGMYCSVSQVDLDIFVTVAATSNNSVSSCALQQDSRSFPQFLSLALEHYSVEHYSLSNIIHLAHYSVT